MASGIFNEPLPPVEDDEEDEGAELAIIIIIPRNWLDCCLLAGFMYLLVLAMFTLMAAMLALMDLMQSGILVLNLIVPRPIMRVSTVVKLILRLMAMIIQFPWEYFQWLRSLSSW